MWKFCSASDSGGHPLLRSLNKNKGRQTWEYDPAAGTPEQRAEAERLRAAYTAGKDINHHSADELLRLQSADRIRAKKHAPPPGPIPGERESLSPERVESHLKGAISFYECLQQEDGHWPGDYGGPMFLLPGLIIALYTTGGLDVVSGAEDGSGAGGGSGGSSAAGSDENTRYVDIGPVNKVINMLACWLEKPEGKAYQKHLPRIYDYLWVAEDGLKMQGYNGSQLWDTSFAVQAIAETGLLESSASCLARAHEYVEQSQ
ncbi:Cycloartenol synthase, partial [Tetrabaena socialis]